MDTIFINSENGKTSNPNILLLNLNIKNTYEVLKKMLHYQILVPFGHGKT